MTYVVPKYVLSYYLSGAQIVGMCVDYVILSVNILLMRPPAGVFVMLGGLEGALAVLLLETDFRN